MAKKAAKKSRVRRPVQKGSYYWVQLRWVDTGDAIAAWQPARFTGIDFSNHKTWDFIGYASVDGHHFVEVHRVGPKVAGAPK